MLYLLPTPNSFYFRMPVPTELHPYYHKKEIKKSLRTKDRRRAEKMVVYLTEQYREQFEKLREPKMTYPFTKIETTRIEVYHDKVVIEGLKTDPLYPEAENLAVQNLLKQAKIGLVPYNSYNFG